MSSPTGTKLQVPKRPAPPSSHNIIQSIRSTTSFSHFYYSAVVYVILAHAMATLNAHVVAWVASAVVKETSDAELAKKHHTRASVQQTLVARLTTVGLKVLTIKELKGVWKNLKHKEFVYGNTRGYATSLSGQAKKEQWVQFIEQYLLLPGALRLEPFVNNDEVNAGAAAAAPAAAVPPHPHYASTYNAHQNRIIMQPELQFDQILQAQMAQVAAFRREVPPYAAAAAPPHTHHNIPNYHGMNGLAYATAISQPQRQNKINSQTSSYGSPKKRKASDSADRNRVATNPAAAAAVNPWADDVPAVAAAASTITAAASASSSNSNTPADATQPQSMVEMRILSELSQMGFPDKKECLDAIRHEVANSAQTPTSDMVMMAIITQREENEEAKKMDQARLLSEQDNKDTAELLREKRKLEEDDRLLHATYAEWLDPKSSEDQKVMFPRSWLLRHKPSKGLLMDIVNNRDLTEAKKSLIQLLKLEKKARLWYAEDFAKPYFTCVVAKRLLNASSENLKKEIDDIEEEAKQATSLPSKQDKDGKPHIFIKAKEENSTAQAPGESTTAEDDDGDDSDIEVLTEEEVRQIQAKSTKNKPKQSTQVVL